MGLFQRLGLGRNPQEEICDRVESAVSSLRARGIVQELQRDAPDALRLQWSRGNFGQRFGIRKRGRHWDLVVVPIANASDVFGGSNPGGDITPLGTWSDCGQQTVIQGIQRIAHVELIERIFEIEATHPVPAWFAEQCETLAAGRMLDHDSLRAMSCLGARRFFKTLPNADRLQKSIEPMLVTLLRASMNNRPPAANDVKVELDVFAGEDHARSLAEALQESHPLEAKRAAQKYAMARAG